MESVNNKLLQTQLADFLLQNCEEGIVGFDEQLNCTHWNASMENLTGFSKEDCLGKHLPDFMPFLEKTGEIKFYRKALKGEASKVENQLFFIPEKGCYGRYTAKYVPLFNEPGKVEGGMVFVQDTSKYFTALQALQEAEEKYASLVNNSPKAIVVFTENEVLFANQKTMEILGFDHPSDIIGKDPLSFVAVHQRKAASLSIQAILSNQLQEPVKYSLIKGDGGEIDAEITYLHMEYRGKQAIQAIIRNITEESRSLNELMNHKQMLNEAQSIAKLGSYRLNTADLSVFWTEGLYRILEIIPGSIQPSFDTYLSFVAEPVKEELKGLVQKISNGEMQEASSIHKVKVLSGKEKHIKIVGKPKFDEEGKVSSIVGTVQDITEIRSVEEELFRANQILDLHFQNSPLGIIQLNSELKVTGWSRQAEEVFGWQATEVMGKHLLSWRFVHEESLQYFRNKTHNNFSDNFNYKKSNTKLYTKNSTVVYCDLFMSGISGEDGKVHSILILLNDVTSRQISEQARLDGQLEERKRIAREIHDGIGQMLIATKYKIAGLEEIVPEEDQFKIQTVEAMIEQTLEEVRSVSRNLAPRSVASLGLESSLRQMVDQIRKLTEIDITFRYIGGGQEVNNKIVNALYRIAQEATNNIIKHAQATVANIQVFQGRNFIELKVEDNGKGLGGSSSSGMGIKNMEERARLLGGRFQMHSDPGFGTNLIINIPLEQQEINN